MARKEILAWLKQEISNDEQRLEQRTDMDLSGWPREVAELVDDLNKASKARIIKYKRQIKYIEDHPEIM